MLVQHPPQYQDSHTEAVTLIVLHGRQEEGDFVVRSSDTDVLVILIAMIGAHLEDKVPTKYGRVVMDCRTQVIRKDTLM